MLPVSLVVTPSGGQEARDVGPERHCGKTARLRGVVVAMRRDCCACVRLRTSWRCRGTWWQCGETAIKLVQRVRAAADRSLGLRCGCCCRVDAFFISPTLPVIACTLLSRLVGRCGHICFFRIDSVCFACALFCPLQPFCFVARHAAFQDALIHALQQPFLFCFSVAAANVLIHEGVVQKRPATPRALSARQQCFLTLHILGLQHGCDQDKTVF